MIIAVGSTRESVPAPAVFAAVVGTGILLVGFLFNAVL